MAKFIQKKELDGMEEVWVHPFKHLQFFYATATETYNVKGFMFKPDVWLHKTVFTDISEAVMHVVQQMGGIPPHNGGKVQLYHVLATKPIRRYKMTLLDPQDDLSMACELYEPVTFEFNNTIIIEDIIWTNGRISDVHYRAQLASDTALHKYSESKRDGFKEPYDTYDTLKHRQPIQVLDYEESALSEMVMESHLKNMTPQSVMGKSLLDASKGVSPARKNMLNEYNRIYKDAIESIGESHKLQAPNLELRPIIRTKETSTVLKMSTIKNRNEKGEN